MSKFAVYVALALLCIWQFAGAASAQTPAAEDLRDGTIKTVQGSVAVVRGDARIEARVGGAVHASDSIQTGANSATAVTLMDGTELSIGPDSTVELKTFRFNPTTHDGNVLVNLLRGTLRMATGLIAKLKPEQVKVTTPTTVIGVRGTDFIVEVRP